MKVDLGIISIILPKRFCARVYMNQTSTPVMRYVMRRFCGQQRVSIRPNQLLRYNVLPTEKCKHDMWTHKHSFISKSTYIQIYMKIKSKFLFFSYLPENIYQWLHYTSIQRVVLLSYQNKHERKKLNIRAALEQGATICLRYLREFRLSFQKQIIVCHFTLYIQIENGKQNQLIPNNKGCRCNENTFSTI